MTRAGKAAAVSLEIRYDGKAYIVSPFSEADWSELEYWIQETTLERDLKLCEKLPDAETKKEKQAEAYERARLIVSGSPAFGRAILSQQGSLRVAWMALKKENDITYDEVVKLCNDEGFRDAMQAKIDSMNSADPEDVNAAKKKTRKKVRAKGRTKRKKKRR